MKSEPDCYSISDLAKERTTMWDGVRNYQVRNLFRDEMKVGDKALFYHSNAGKGTGVAGVMKVVSEAYSDPTQFKPKDEHYDPKSKKDNPRWLCVDVQFLEEFKEVVTLPAMKSYTTLHGMKTLQKGNRLSVTRVTKKEFDFIVRKAK